MGAGGGEGGGGGGGVAVGKIEDPMMRGPTGTGTHTGGGGGGGGGIPEIGGKESEMSDRVKDAIEVGKKSVATKKNSPYDEDKKKSPHLP